MFYLVAYFSWSDPCSAWVDGLVWWKTQNMLLNCFAHFINIFVKAFIYLNS